MAINYIGDITVKSTVKGTVKKIEEQEQILFLFIRRNKK